MSQVKETSGISVANFEHCRNLKSKERPKNKTVFDDLLHFDDLLIQILPKFSPYLRMVVLHRKNKRIRESENQIEYIGVTNHYTTRARTMSE